LKGSRADPVFYDIGQEHIGQLRIVAFFMVFQPFSEVLSISNIRLVAMNFSPGSAGFVFFQRCWACECEMALFINLIIGKVMQVFGLKFLAV
jgi:hypothetical protein